MKIFEEKRGQGMPMNIIVIAAIALLVLVVLAAIFIGRSGQFVSSAKSCTGQGGACTTTGTATKTATCSAGQATVPNTDCKDNQVCCITI